MRIDDIREISVPISRYADPSVPSGGPTTSMVALITDVIMDGQPVVGYGFASIGRFAQGGLIRDRFAPRLLAARDDDVMDEAGTNLDPFRAWKVMMAGEKPGGHGERCVAVGTLDMALWDAAAKIAGVPLYRHLGDRIGFKNVRSRIGVYAGGGYYYPSDDLSRLTDEVRRLAELGYQRVKIKIGGAPLQQDLRRIEAVARLLPAADHLAVDAIYAYTRTTSIQAAAALRPLGLWSFSKDGAGLGPRFGRMVVICSPCIRWQRLVWAVPKSIRFASSHSAATATMRSFPTVSRHCRRSPVSVLKRSKSCEISFPPSLMIDSWN
jgi:D(-)-tartrate dehydratase